MNKNKKNAYFIAIALIVSIIALISSLGCEVEGSYQYFDTAWSFDYAQIRMPDGQIIEGYLESWKDFEDGDQLQVKIDGSTYLVHSSNVVLIKNY